MTKKVKITISLLVSCAFLLDVGYCLAQEKFSGKVVDAENGQGLAGAQLLIADSLLDVSNSQGRFSFAYSNEQIEISVQYLGYALQKLALSKGDNASIFMIPTEAYLQSVAVIDGSRGQRRLNYKGAIAFVDAVALRRDDQLSPAAVLNRVPGVFMHSGTLGTNRLTIRGIGSRTPFGTNKLKAYFGDIPISDVEGGTVIEDIDLSLLEQIKVLRGPAGSLYGAGLGGAIVLSPLRTAPGKSYAELTGQVGSFGTFRQVGRAVVGTENAQISLNLNSIQSDGYRQNNQYYREGIGVTGRFFNTERLTTDVLLNFTKVKSYIPSSVDSLTFAENPQKADVGWNNIRGYEDYQKLLLGLGLNYDYSVGGSINQSVFVRHFSNYEPRPFNILRENTLFYGYRARISQEVSVANRPLQFSVGTELQAERYNWQTYGIDSGERTDILSNNASNRSYINIFSQIDYVLSAKISVELAANITYLDYAYEDLGTSGNLTEGRNFDAVLSPKIAAHYQWADRNSVYGLLSQGFSPPSVEETLLPNGAINPAIRPEQGWNMEIGGRGYLRNWLTYDFSLYRMWVSDLLVARRTAADQFIGLNAGQSTHSGVELQLAGELKFGSLKLAPFLNYSYSEVLFTDFIENGISFNGNSLPGVPDHQLTAGTDWSGPSGFYGNINLQHTGAMYLRDENQGVAEAYTLLNGQIGWQQQWWEQLTTDVAIGGQNLTDTHYAGMLLVNASSFGGRPPRYYYPGLPRNYYLRLGIKWNFKGSKSGS